jgi:hypothetical protein
MTSLSPQISRNTDSYAVSLASLPICHSQQQRGRPPMANKSYAYNRQRNKSS